MVEEHTTEFSAKMGAEVISLPELYSSHYFCQSEDVDNFALAEPLYSTSFIAFSELAKELSVVIIVPFFETCKFVYVLFSFS